MAVSSKLPVCSVRSVPPPLPGPPPFIRWRRYQRRHCCRQSPSRPQAPLHRRLILQILELVLLSKSLVGGDKGLFSRGIRRHSSASGVSPLRERGLSACTMPRSLRAACVAHRCVGPRSSESSCRCPEAETMAAIRFSSSVSMVAFKLITFPHLTTSITASPMTRTPRKSNASNSIIRHNFRILTIWYSASIRP
jgi:hypothetical protein